MNTIAAYLGCAGIVIGGVGLAYKMMAPAADPPRDAPVVEAAPSPASAEWPPANGAVAFHDEMIELLSPPKTQTAAPEHQHAAPEPTTTGQAQQQAAPEREVVRDLAPDRRQQRRTSRPSRQVPPATPDDATAADGDPVTVGRSDSRSSTRDRNRDAFVIGRDGRRYRIDRADRAQATEAEELPAEIRRYRIEREPPVERRGPGFMPDPFRIFGPSTGGW